MKVFWTVLLLLAAVAVGVIVWRRTPEPGTTGLASANGIATMSGPVGGEAGMSGEASHQVAADATADEQPDVAASEPARTAEPDVAPPEAEPLPEVLDALVRDVVGAPTPPELSAPEAKPREDAEGGESEEGGPALVHNDDGSITVGDRFVIRGEGTKENPYEIPWELLTSAQETYKPRLSQRTLPAWLEVVDDKHVRITGYIAFPVMAQSPDEMLMMLNQWDGCCIGVPPTPYDAIEVKLKKVAEGDERFKTYGTVEGKLNVDPYLVKDWLVGLYTMDDAVLTSAR